MRIVVVGGAGFIGSAVSRFFVAHRGASVLVIDKLTAASSLASLGAIAHNPRYSLRKADICQRERIAGLIQAFAPDAIVHAAFEKSAGAAIGSANAVVDTNLVGTWSLLEATRAYWSELPAAKRERFRFLSVSRDGDPADAAGAIRLAADQLIAFWHTSYGMPAIISKAAATYGPHQFPAEPVPAVITAALDGTPPGPAIGETTGRLLHVDDHVRALAAMLERGIPGRTYEISGTDAGTPSALAQRIERLVDRHGPRARATPGRALAVAVAGQVPMSGQGQTKSGRACDALFADTGWRAEHTLESGLSDSVRWYLANEAWWRPLQAAATMSDTYGLLRIA